MHPKRKHTGNRFWLPTFLALVGLIAQTASAEDYDVEILVYASLLPDNGEEAWPAPQQLPASDQALNIGEGGTRMLEGPRTLQAIADTLRRSSQYRPLLHWRWRQAATGQTQAVHVQIPAGSALPLTDAPDRLATSVPADYPLAPENGAGPATDAPLLDGTVTLKRSRFLHLTVDLVYFDPRTGGPVRLNETRRMKSGELHYLDHPRLGVLARVTPADAVP